MIYSPRVWGRLLLSAMLTDQFLLVVNGGGRGRWPCLDSRLMWWRYHFSRQIPGAMRPSNPRFISALGRAYGDHVTGQQVRWQFASEHRPLCIKKLMTPTITSVSGFGGTSLPGHIARFCEPMYSNQRWWKCHETCVRDIAIDRRDGEENIIIALMLRRND